MPSAAGGRPAITKAGVPLDAAYVRRLVEEAEPDFDPETLVRRRACWPPLSGRGGRSNRVELRVDSNTHRIRRIAEGGNREVSDGVRDAIRRYLEASCAAEVRLPG